MNTYKSSGELAERLMSTKRTSRARLITMLMSTLLAISFPKDLTVKAGILKNNGEGTSPKVELKVKLARKQLATSIRAYAAATVAYTNCQVKGGRISRKMSTNLIKEALLEVGISPDVAKNPQVQRAASMLGRKLNPDCKSPNMTNAEALKIVEDEL